MTTIRKQSEIDKVYKEFDIIYTNIPVKMKYSIERMVRKIIKLRKEKQRFVQRARELKK